MYKKLIEDVNQIVNPKFSKQNTLSGYQIYQELIAEGHIEEVELSEGMLDSILAKFGDKYPKSKVRVKLQKLEKDVGTPGFEKVLDKELSKGRDDLISIQKNKSLDKAEQEEKSHLQKMYVSALRLLLDKQSGRLKKVGHNSGLSKYKKQAIDKESVVKRIA